MEALLKISAVSTSRRAVGGLMAAVVLLGGVATARADTFTVFPGANGLAGGAFTADQFLFKDYSSINYSDSTHFVATGLLPISSAQLGGASLSGTGLNATYGLYLAYTATGVTSPFGTPGSGTYTTFDYSLRGANGSSSFGFSGNTPTTTASLSVALGTGSLVAGSIDVGSSNVFASLLSLSFSQTNSAFVSPQPFYSYLNLSITDLGNAVTTTASGYTLQNGVGTATFSNVASVSVPAPVAVPGPVAGAGFFPIFGVGLAWFARRRKVADRT